MFNQPGLGHIQYATCNVYIVNILQTEVLFYYNNIYIYTTSDILHNIYINTTIYRDFLKFK